MGVSNKLTKKSELSRRSNINEVNKKYGDKKALVETEAAIASAKT